MSTSKAHSTNYASLYNYDDTPSMNIPNKALFLSAAVPCQNKHVVKPNTNPNTKPNPTPSPNKENFTFYVSGDRKPCRSWYGFDESYPKGLYQGKPIGFEYTPMEDRHLYAGKMDNTSEEVWRDGMQSKKLFW